MRTLFIDEAGNDVDGRLILRATCGDRFSVELLAYDRRREHELPPETLYGVVALISTGERALTVFEELEMADFVEAIRIYDDIARAARRSQEAAPEADWQSASIASGGPPCEGGAKGLE